MDKIQAKEKRGLNQNIKEKQFNCLFQDCLDTGASPFSFDTLKGMFLLLGLAFITSLVIMVVEYLVRYCKQREPKHGFRNHFVSQQNGFRKEVWK